MKRMKWNKNKGRKNNYLCEMEMDETYKASQDEIAADANTEEFDTSDIVDSVDVTDSQKA